MSEGHVGPPPDAEPPAPPPGPAEPDGAHAAESDRPSWLPPAAAPEPEPAAEPLAPPPGYPPAPGYPPPDDPAPPGYAPPVAPAPTRRNARTIVIAAIVVLVVVVAAAGYAGAGYAFSASRLASAHSTYNTVISHQNTITDEFNAFDAKLSATNPTTVTSADLKSSRTTYDQLVSQAQAALPTIASDDASLAAAQSGLSDNSWLTVLNRSNLDHASAKIDHERSALASAKTLTADLVQLGTFYLSLYDGLIDVDTLDTKATAKDFTGAAAAVVALKTDIGKALLLSSAPGLPPEMKQFLTDFQSFAVDFAKLLNDATTGNSTAAQADLKVIEAEATKLQGYDFDKISTAIKSFYQTLIDAFNSEVVKANSL